MNGNTDRIKDRMTVGDAMVRALLLLVEEGRRRQAMEREVVRLEGQPLVRLIGKANLEGHQNP